MSKAVRTRSLLCTEALAAGGSLRKGGSLRSEGTTDATLTYGPPAFTDLSVPLATPDQRHLWRQVSSQSGRAYVAPEADPQAGGAANKLAVASALPFTPISLVWRSLCYYVPAAKGATGAAAANVMPKDAEGGVAGKKRLLHNVTGA